MEFRIRETQVGLRADDIRTYFYPEALISRKEVPKWKIWEKEKTVEDWGVFDFNPDNLELKYDIVSNTKKNSFARYVCFSTMKQAQEFIEKYKIVWEKHLIDFENKFLMRAGGTMISNSTIIHKID